MSDVLTTAQAGAYLGIAPSTVRSWVAKGWLQPVLGGRPHRFRWLDVECSRVAHRSAAERAAHAAMSARWHAMVDT